MPRNKKEGSKGFATFFGVLLSGEFTVLVLILSFENFSSLNLNSLEIHLLLSVTWLIISIFSCFETIIGFINFDMDGEISNYNRASCFYYLGFYSFFLSIQHFLLFKTLFSIALILFCLVFYKILQWTNAMIYHVKEIKMNLSEKSNIDKVFSYFSIISLILYIILLHVIYYFFIGNIAISNINSNLVLLYHVGFFVVWIVSVPLIIYKTFIKSTD